MLKVKTQVITLKMMTWVVNESISEKSFILTWELIDIKEPEVVLPYDDDEPT